MFDEKLGLKLQSLTFFFGFHLTLQKKIINLTLIAAINCTFQESCFFWNVLFNLSKKGAKTFKVN